MQTVFIGAGNLATQMAKIFHKKGLNIVQIYSRTEKSARELALQVGAEHTNSLSALKRKADLYICALKDDALPEVLAQLPDCKGIFVHTAGSVPMDIFENLFPNFGVFYPLQTFSKNREVDFEKIPILVEANNAETETFLLEIAKKISRNVQLVNSEQRSMVHLSAVFACNFVNRMYSLAEEILKKADLPFEILLPLIDETARKIHEMPPKKAQTGPAIRYDKTIINKQLHIIDDLLTKEIYEKISKNIYDGHSKEILGN